METLFFRNMHACGIILTAEQRSGVIIQQGMIKQKREKVILRIDFLFPTNIGK